MSFIFGIGVSTGGSYTDAVIMSLDGREIVAKAKSRTTHYDLSIGIINSIDSVLSASGIPKDQIALVSLASTLATNAIIEGKGARVGLLLIGYELEDASKFKPEMRWDLPVVSMAKIRGGHNSDGVEKEALDLEAIASAVKIMNDNVDSFAISSYFSIRNPVHELMAKEIVRKRTEKPVTCGYELATELGIYERTVTAVLNARLIPIIENLLREIREALEQRGIVAPLMIVKGDGSLVNEEVAKERPVESIQSGPAASVLGGMFLAGKKDAVVVDMGSTTSIMTAFKEGNPQVIEEGVRIAGWKTRVKAVDADAWGIGGDGWIRLGNDCGIEIGPQRVIPLAFATSVFPSLLEKIERFETTDFFTVSQAPKKAEDAGPLSQRFLETVHKIEPACLVEINQNMKDLPLTDLFVPAFIERGYISRIGLTPTDLMHIKGAYNAGDAKAATLGVNIFTKKIGLTVDKLCDEVWRIIIERLVFRIVEKMVLRLCHQELSQGCIICPQLIKKISNRSVAGDFQIHAILDIPIIGIGAPIHLFLHEVAKKLGTMAIVPEHHEVGAAVGSLIGSVVGSFEAYITKEVKPDRYVVFPGRNIFDTLEKAIDFAVKIGTEEASNRARRAGATDLEIKIDRKDRVFPKVGFSWSNLKISAVGRPAMKKP